MFHKPLVLLFFIGFSQLFLQPLSAQDLSGKIIYANQCASCHGDSGQGVPEKYKSALTGDLSIEALAEVIEATMPSENPDLCIAQDADSVAQFVYDTFYSPEAQAKNAKAKKIELTHRTNLQYKNSIADLAALFGGKIWIEQGMSERGFKGRYFSSRSFDSTKSIGERTDRKLEFDFGSGSPFSPEVKMEEFGIQWYAALQVEETGRYDFFVDSPNGVRLFVNESRTPVIDAWVSTGAESHEASVYLLAGQVYLIKLDMFKFQEESARVSLQWRPPYGKIEPIPVDLLQPIWAPTILVPNTVLPPDDSSVGFPRGVSVSRAWMEATSESAIQVANELLANQEKYMGIGERTGDSEEKLKKFCRRFAKFAFSRPLTDEQLALYVTSQFEKAESPRDAAKRSILLVLQSPRFLYPELGSESPDSYTVASRLALTLWDSVPDQELWSAASGGNLDRALAVESQVRRMVDDPRTRAKIRGFFHQWLQMDASDLTKDEELYPEFNNEIAMDLRKSLDLFLDDVVWTEGADYRRLYLSDELYVSRLMSNYYEIRPKEGQIQGGRTSTIGGESPPELGTTSMPEFDGFLKVQTGNENSAGILTHPYLMTDLSYHRTTSPIHRGVFVSRQLIGRTLKQPPENFEPLKEDFDVKMTTRQRVAHQTQDASCQSCHSFINPLGFSFETYDAVGRLRSEEKGKPIDSTSAYTTEGDVTFDLNGPRDLANYLVESEKARKNFIRHLFQHLVKNRPSAYGQETLEFLDRSFVQNGFNIRRLIMDITQLTALHGTEAAVKLEIVRPSVSNSEPTLNAPIQNGEIR